MNIHLTWDKVVVLFGFLSGIVGGAMGIAHALDSIQVVQRDLEVHIVRYEASKTEDKDEMKEMSNKISLILQKQASEAAKTELILQAVRKPN